MDHCGTGWVQCPALCKAEGGAAAPQLLLEEESGLSIPALILLDVPVWAGLGRAEQLCARQGCRAGQAGPPAHLVAAQVPPSASATSPLQGTRTLLSKQLCDQALGGREREEPLHPARLQRLCLPWCPTPALSVLRGRNFIF